MTDAVVMLPLARRAGIDSRRIPFYAFLFRNVSTMVNGDGRGNGYSYYVRSGWEGEVEMTGAR